MKCPGCSEEVNDSLKFCTKCGAKLSKKADKKWIAVIAGGVVVVVGVILLLVFLLPGGGGPETTVKRYMDVMSKGEYGVAVSLLSSEITEELPVGEFIEVAEANAPLVKGFHFKMLKTLVEGDNGVVLCSTEEQPQQISAVITVKENGEWKICEAQECSGTLEVVVRVYEKALKEEAEKAREEAEEVKEKVDKEIDETENDVDDKGKDGATQRTRDANLRTIDGAIGSYYYGEGAYPTDLDKLVPEYLEEIPKDPMGGTYYLDTSEIKPEAAVK